MPPSLSDDEQVFLSTPTTMLLTGLLLLLRLRLGIRRAVDTHLVVAERIRQRPLAQSLPVAAEAALAAAPAVAEVLQTALPGLAVPVHDPPLRAGADLDETPAVVQRLVGDGVADRVLAVRVAGDLVHAAAAGGVVVGHHELAGAHGGWLGVQDLRW